MGRPSDSAVAPKSDWITEHRGHDQTRKREVCGLCRDWQEWRFRPFIREVVAEFCSLAAELITCPSLGEYPCLHLA